MVEGERRKFGIRALIAMAVAAWLIYDLASATEAPSEAVVILHYVLLALCVIGGVGYAWRFFTAE